MSLFDDYLKFRLTIRFCNKRSNETLELDSKVFDLSSSSFFVDLGTAFGQIITQLHRIMKGDRIEN